MQTLITANGDRHGPYLDDQIVDLTRGRVRADEVQPGDCMCIAGRFCVAIESTEES